MKAPFTHDDLVQIGRDWCLRPWKNADSGHSGCGLVIAEMTSSAFETPDVIGWNSYSSILIEAKTSRSDFKRDHKKVFRRCPDMGVGKQRYFITPKGLISKDELPDNWGLIEVNDEGKTRVVQNSGRFVSEERSEVTMLLSLIRRLKIEPDRHIAIKGYTLNTLKEPKATFHLVKEGGFDE